MIKSTAVLPEFIKDPTLVADYFKDPLTGNQTFVIKNNKTDGSPVKLSDVIHHLPSGFCSKSETGFGATTAEMRATRNSIIVEPSRATAWGKYLSHDEKKYGPKLFVGTQPGETSATDQSEIRRFLGLHCSSPLPMKIFCVMDSLPKVKSELQTTTLSRSRFHLFVDEQDSLSHQANYRNSMNIGMDIYKSFPEEDRTAVSATFIQPSDPEIESEPLTEFRYENPETKNVELILSNSTIPQAKQTLEELLLEKPREKIVVGINHFDPIEDIIKYLTEEKNIIHSKDVKILCSETSKESAKRHFGRLENDILPGRLNFLTSAYFTGVDILEPFHAIALVDPNKKAFALSESDLKQFMGRGRKGLLSAKIIHKNKLSRPVEIHSKKHLISDAKNAVEGLICLTNHLSASQTIKQEVFDNRSKFAEAVAKVGYPLVYVDAKSEYKVSFNNIDAILEKYRLFSEVYSVEDGMKKALEAKGFNVTVTFGASSSKAAASAARLRFQDCGLLMKVVKEASTSSRVISTDTLKKFPGLLRSVGETFNEHFGIIEAKSLGNIITDVLLTKEGKLSTFPTGISKKLESTRFRLWFISLPETNSLKAHVKSLLKPGQVWEKSELIEEVGEVWQKATFGTGSFGWWRGETSKDYLKFVRLIFRVDDVKNQPNQIKLMDYHFDPDVVLKQKKGKKSKFYVGDYKEAS